MPARILVVDDEPDLELLIRQKFRRQIGDGDYAFAFARDGVEALALIGADPGIDIVLSDINMPGMDGLTLLNRLKENPRLLRAVIISAYGDMKNIRTAMNRGAFDFVTKPIDFPDLSLTLARTLADLQALRAARQQQAEAERARANLARYFSPNLANHLAEHPDLELGGERRDLSFLSTDLADFTPLAETLDAVLTVQLMNKYIGGLSEIVFQYGGTVHTVVGDAIYAMFGAPLQQPDHAVRAVACALAIDRFAQSFASEKNAQGIAVGTTRIGVNSGQAIVGNCGGEGFFHYTAYGDAINTAARLENANKVLGTRICISAETAGRIPGFFGRPIGTLIVKGKDKAIDSYEPLNGEGRMSKSVSSYLRAFRRLKAGDPHAIQAFAMHVGRYDSDGLAAFHLKRLLAGNTGTRIPLGDATE
ncbi:MAG TPA: response regulator [Rhodospirillales bacterium]|nr:response regulator [Rhodospirillales bacterium]